MSKSMTVIPLTGPVGTATIALGKGAKRRLIIVSLLEALFFQSFIKGVLFSGLAGKTFQPQSLATK